MQRRTNARRRRSVPAAEDQAPGAAEHREHRERHREADRSEDEQEEQKGEDRKGDQEEFHACVVFQ